MTLTFSFKAIGGIILYSMIYGLGLGFGFWLIGVIVKHADYFVLGLYEAWAANDIEEQLVILTSLKRRFYCPPQVKNMIDCRVQQLQAAA